MRAALDKKRFGPWALVTGASSRIGKEFAQQIAASGINTVLVARREDLLKEVGVEFSKCYGADHPSRRASCLSGGFHRATRLRHFRPLFRGNLIASVGMTAERGNR